MKAEYDLTKMKSRKNPYARSFKKQITLRLDPDVIEYFKQKSVEHGIPYQTLINLYLQDCRATRRDLKIEWPS
jgi:predicted DNA binding CopG/RHH family protein